MTSDGPTSPTPDEAAAPDLMDRLQESFAPTPDQAAAKIDRFMRAFQGTPTESAWRTIQAERDALRADLAQARRDRGDAESREGGVLRQLHGALAREQAVQPLIAIAREARRVSMGARRPWTHVEREVNAALIAYDAALGPATPQENNHG